MYEYNVWILLYLQVYDLRFQIISQQTEPSTSHFATRSAVTRSSGPRRTIIPQVHVFNVISQPRFSPASPNTVLVLFVRVVPSTLVKIYRVFFIPKARVAYARVPFSLAAYSLNAEFLQPPETHYHLVIKHVCLVRGKTEMWR